MYRRSTSIHARRIYVMLDSRYLIGYTLGMDRSIFKAYDIRGKYPAQINGGVVKEVIPAILKAILGSSERSRRSIGGKKASTTLILGHDARLSSPELYGACIEALDKEKGVTVIQAGLITTPMMYFLVNRHNTDGGIMVTASHNPKEYNGLKMVRKQAIPVSGMDVLKYIRK